jgi:hypothetical protein
MMGDSARAESSRACGKRRTGASAMVLKSRPA